MKIEQLENGNKISKEMEKCRKNIDLANYTQEENVVLRDMYLSVNGLDVSITVPKSLFRVVGKLILIEYQQRLIDLEKELESL